MSPSPLSPPLSPFAPFARACGLRLLSLADTEAGVVVVVAGEREADGERAVPAERGETDGETEREEGGIADGAEANTAASAEMRCVAQRARKSGVGSE